MNTTSNVTLKKIEDFSATELVEILNNDSKLQDALGGSNKNKISELEFIEYNSKWAKDNNADMFAILLDNIAIGAIST